MVSRNKQQDTSPQSKRRGAKQFQNKSGPVVSMYLKQLAANWAQMALTCESSPQPEIVHNLRTSSRRIESLLAEARYSKDKRFAKAAVCWSRSLKKTRKAAGRVRDLDVQEHLLAALILKEEDKRKLANEVKALWKPLRRERTRAAKRLERIVAKERGYVDKERQRFGLLLERRGWPTTQLSQPLLRARVAKALAGAKQLTIDSLHALRKKLKGMRYLAEATPGCEQEARRLHEVLDGIGNWHDRELLRQRALHKGKSAVLELLSDHAQEAYRDALAVIQTLLTWSAAGTPTPSRGAVRRGKDPRRAG